MIDGFIAGFTEQKIEHSRIGRDYFLIRSEIKDTMDLADRQPLGAGIYLGTEKAKRFTPSLALLEIISKTSEKKVFVDDDAEWLFLCGRDLFKDSIKTEMKKGLVLVQNKDDENLGYGMLRDGFVKNLLDRGDFLRRER